MFSRHKKATLDKSLKTGKAQEIKELIETSLKESENVLVKEVMTPRVDVVALEIPVALENVINAIKRSGHSRFPVFHGDLDQLVGVLFLKDLLRDERWWQAIKVKMGSKEDNAQENNPTLNGQLSPLQFSRFFRAPFLVPETRPILEVLSEMQSQHRDFALVVDEHGGVSGILTIKDILGRIVGELPDEFDAPEPPEIIRVDESRWLIDGATGVDEVSKTLGIEIPEGEYVTISGYLLDVLGDIPKEGASVELENWSFKVVEMDKRRVAKIIAQRLE